MSKRFCIIIALLSVFIIGAIFIFIFMIAKRDRLLIKPQITAEINYNNYVFDNCVDYKGNKFAWLKLNFFGTKLTILDNKDNYQYLKKINSPFQINNNQILFVTNNKLQLIDIDTKLTTQIASGVDKFIAYQSYIIYSSVRIFDDKVGKWTNKLYIYDILSKESKIIYEDIKQFYIYKEKLYSVNNEKWLIEISLSDYTVKKIINFKMEQEPLYVLPQGDNLLYLHSNQLVFFNLKTGAVKTVSIVNNTYANNRINYICDDNNVYLSFQATKSNGSIVTNIKDNNNGLWEINPQTLKKEKICSDVFDRLYLFNGNLLLGSKNNSLYKVDIKTKQSMKVSY